VSKYGRLQDAMHDALFGRDEPKGPLGIVGWVDGPLAGCPSEVQDAVMTRATEIAWIWTLAAETQGGKA